MSNSKRGAIAFTAAGVAHQLRFTTNAMVHYQDTTGETLTEGLRALDDHPDDLRRFLNLFHAGVASSEPELTTAEAGDIVDELGLPEASRLLGEAIRAAFPQAEAEGDTAGQAASGNGKSRKTPATT
ncbi:hypothetical protein EKE94_03190 [Mesobaculum littorinae]|uniref:Uncharacterized protein n=1 Tax=Mesobaculum littorinae TaxID=2486419 RepID=A0A438AM15_9RHOB|nr:hypothetical protein [Mesobaculum littorinae]RVV99700.1 hypothetical protein EKE94_03190 [Mesobaculum littorinae]